MLSSCTTQQKQRSKVVVRSIIFVLITFSIIFVLITFTSNYLVVVSVFPSIDDNQFNLNMPGSKKKKCARAKHDGIIVEK